MYTNIICNHWLKCALKSSVFAGVFFCLLISGCAEQDQKDASYVETENQKVRHSQGTLVLYNWEDYIGSRTLSSFEEQTGIKVQLFTYEDDEEVISGIQSGSINPDLVILSESLAREMQTARLLKVINSAEVPNLVHINGEKFKITFDSGHDYHDHIVPYFVGTTGLAVNTRFIPDGYRSWNILWDKRLKGKIAMLNNPFEVAGAASKLLGFPLNPLPEQLPFVRDKLLEQKPLLAGYYDAVTLSSMLVEEEIWAAQIYSGDGLIASELNEDIAFVIPEEGCAIWMDVFIIPQGAENVAQAHKFINYVHEPAVNAEIASELWVKTLNSAAEKYIDPEVIDSPKVNPPDEIIALCEFFGDMGAAESVRGRLQIWSELLSDR